MSRTDRPEAEDWVSSALTVPNLLSAFRILLVPLFIWTFLERKTIEPLVIFFIAAISDLFDGFIARHLHQRSRLGTILDPAGDKLLTAASYILLTLPGIGGPNRVPLWLTIIVFARDLMIVGGVLWAYLIMGVKTVLPVFLGKLTTAFQVGTVFLILLPNHLGKQAGWMLVFYALTAGFTLASWILYYQRGLRLLRERRAAEES